MRRHIVLILLCTVCVFTVQIPCETASGEGKGRLDSFEEELEKPKKENVEIPVETPAARKPSKKKVCEEAPAVTEEKSELSAGEAATTGILQILIPLFLAGLMETGTDNYHDLYRELKETENPALPTLRIEPAYQYLVGNLHGFSGKAEVGYLIIGVDGEYLRYWEKAPNDDLTIASGHGLLRALFADFIGTNLAVGVKSLWGNRRHTGFEIGIPFYIFAGKHLIFDVQPFWAMIRGSDVYDVAGGLSFKYKFFGVRAAYRALMVGGETLHGPRVGLFFQW